MRKYARQDANHKEVKAAFERAGCSVLDLSSLGRGVPDMVAALGGVAIFVEVKDGAKPPSARKLTPDEEKFRMNWRGGYRVVQDLDGVEEAVSVLRKWHECIRKGMCEV